MNQLLTEALYLYLTLIIVIYAFFRIKQTTAVVDTCWSLGHWLVGSWLFMQNPQPTIYNLIVYICLSLWAFRLSAYIFFTRVYDTKHQEKRYDKLLQKDNQTFNVQFLKQIILQTTLIYILMAPFYIALLQPLTMHPISCLLLSIVFLFAWYNEALTDWQRHQFRKNNSGILQAGWWSLSRHPNYFFELVMWFTFTAFAVYEPYGLLTLISPILLLALMLKITIPVTENYALQNNPASYKKYQQTTAKLIPWPIRRD